MASNPNALLAALLDTLTASGALTQPAVAAAFRAVPRHLFLPGLPLAEVYADEAIPTKLAEGHPISSSSQPAMMAIMLEQLDLAPGQRVLEIGAGTGFNAALIGHLVGPQGRVVTVDIDDDLVAAARQHLAAAGAHNVLAVCADGGAGCAAEAPYDRIILTVGAWDITPAWLEQLKPGGRLVLPLAMGTSTQKSVAFEKAAQPTPGQPVLSSRSIRDCGFMRLRGAFAGPEQTTALGPTAGLNLSLVGGLPVAPETVYAWLTGGAQDVPAGFRLAPRAIWEGLSFWLGVNEPSFCELLAEGDLARRGPAPCLFEFEGSRPMCVNLGALDTDGVCLLWLAPAGKHDKNAADKPRELWARSFGPDSRRNVQNRLLGQIQAWDAAGRPGSTGMFVQVYPVDAPLKAAPGLIVVTKRWTRLAITWPKAAS